MSHFSYRTSCAVFRLFYGVICRIEIGGRENVPSTGGCLLMANHISHFDPPILGIYLKRDVDYMADLPLFKIPIVGFLIKSWNAFSIDRTKAVDRGAIKTAIERAKAGKMVGIFPDRGLRTGEKSIVGDAQIPVGLASLWQMTEVPVVPAIIIGSDQLYRWQNVFKRPRVWVLYGPPLPVNKDETREQARDRLQAALKDLYKEVLTRYEISKKELPRTAQERWAES